MTIRKGEPWGGPGPLPDDGVVVAEDREASAALDVARRDGRPFPVLGLVGGDLARTCGARADATRLRGPDAQRLPVDVGVVVIDGVLRHFVAHLVLRRPARTGGWWRGPITAVMNAQFLGPWDVAPRGHPNDGRLDVVEADLSIGDRWKARSRLPLGTHVPHPGITTSRRGGLQLDVPSGAHVWLDGVRLGAARSLSIRLEPDALDVVV